MKTTMKKILFLALALIGSNGHAALTEVDKSLYSERNLLPNPGFENGKNTWLSSSATLTATTTAANVLNGAASGSILISSNGGYVRSKTVAVPTGLYGQACEARVFFKGGDALTTFEVYNRDNTLLGSQTLVAQSAPGVQSVFFLCPTAAQVAGDADTGFIYSQIKQTTAGTHTVMYTDSWYMGALLDLGEATLPDLFSAAVSSTDVVSNESTDFINGNCTNATTGRATCIFNSGIFSVTPVCHATINSTVVNQSCGIVAASTDATQVQVTCRNTNTSTEVDTAFNLTCQKQGVDAKQSVQVYKTIPKVSANINEFSAKIGDSGIVTDENTDWINGNCVDSGTTGTCTLTSSIFGVAPTCIAVGVGTTTANPITVAITSASTSTVVYNQTQAGVGSMNVPINLYCQKASTDYKMPMVQPVVVGQIQVGATAVEATFSADLNCDAASSVTSSNLSGITVGNRSSTTCAVTLPSGFFSATPRCTFTVKATTVQATATNPTSATAVAIYGPSADYDGTLTCWGAK